MRFIIGFIFFGLLFYAIWYFEPEIFNTLVSYAAKIFNFIKDAVSQLLNKKGAPSPAPEHPAPQGLFFY